MIFDWFLPFSRLVFCVLVLLSTSLPVSLSVQQPALQSSVTPEPTQRPENWLLPDAEVVYSPTALDFDVDAYLAEQGGYLNTYQQYLMITGWSSAAEIIERVARENSINPRLLLALLEYQSGCIFGQPEDVEHFDTAMGAGEYYRKDLYGQLVWAARVLSEGFYGRLEGTLSEISYPDGTISQILAEVNAGTVAIHYFFAQLYDHEACTQALDAQNGFPALYESMFADPWARAETIGALLPSELQQPSLTLPFEPGKTWAYTGGPHKAFESNGPLAALDFAPQIEASGCVPSNEWVVAMTDGLVVRSEFGTVIQDLDGDGYEQTGWAIMYLHIGSEDRVLEGAYLKAGDRIGHPSCEGGRATGTHLHVARKYNGVWLSAGGATPFELDGWVAQAGNAPYKGMLYREDVSIEAHEFGTYTSLITREMIEE
jgi:LasA protease